MELDRIPAQLGDIIEPNEFYICCIKPKSSARVKLNRFSDIVAKDHKALEFDDPEEDINVGQLVYVKRDDDTWTRARVVEVYNSKNRKIWIKVLLIDHGQLLNVFDVYTQVVDIPEKSCSKVPAQSKKFRLEDLQPLESCINYVTNEKSYRASKKWSHESAKLVKTLLSIANNIQVELNNYDEVDDVYTGQLYFCVHHDELKKRGMQAKNQPLSLSRILVKHNHAVELEKEDNGIAVTSEKELFKGDSDSIEELISQMPEPLFSSTHNDEIQLVNPTKKKKKTTKSNVEEVEVSPDFVKFLQHRKESKNSTSSKIKESRLDRLQTTSDLAAIKVSTKPEEVEDVAKFKYKPSLARFLEKKKQLDSLPPPPSSSLSPTTVPKPAAVQAKYLVNVNDKEEVFVHKDPAARTCKPIGRLDDLLDLRLEYFHHLVETLNISSPRHVIQKSMWPIVHNLYSMVAIGSRNKSNPLHGRIGGYLVPLVNQVLTCQDYAPTSNPPLAIILVPDWQSAQDVSEIATELGSHIVLANDGKTFRVGCVFANEMKHAAELYNGCHVLVTTPTSLKRMLDPSINITSLERCSHLIIEFADTCIIKFHQEIDDISKTFLKLRRRFPNQPNQMIVSSDEWSEPIRQYVQCFLMRPDCIGPYFVLGNPLEALVYSKLKFKAHVVETCKQDQLVQLLLNEKKSLSVVFCKDSLSVAKVQRMLQLQHGLQLETISITEEMSKFDKEETCSYIAEKQKNAKAENLVLVMSDQCTLDFPLSLTHLTTIVHYDYSDSKMQFADRFLHMKKCVTSIYSGDKDEEENYCHLLVDPQDDEKQFKTLRLLLERCQCSIPPLLMMSLVSNVEIGPTTTSLSKSAPLCIHIKLFGQCDNLSKCKERHFLTHQIDDQGPAAAAGLIEFSIAMTKSANHFLVLLKKIFNPETGKIFDFLSVDMKLLRLNSRLEFESLESDAELQIGEIYVVKDVDSCSKRVEYVKKSKEQQKITVLFIDEGRYEKLDIDCLYQLPPEFKEELIPRKTSEVILMNVRPKDQQPQWPHEANELVRLALNSRKEEEKQSDQICRSKVVLGLNHTFWVRNVQVLQKVHNQWSAQVELKDQLKSFAQDHFQQMASLLLSLCLNSKIDPDRYQYLRKIVHAWNGSSTLSEEADDHHQNTSVVSSNQSFRIDEEKSIFTSYRTAFFDPDDQVNNEIKVMEIFSPAYFNVQLTKFQPQLKALEAKLKTEFEMFNNNDNFVPIHQQICISKCDEIYCRVQYLLDDNDNDQANEELYLVDYGWYSPIQSKLVPISKQSLEVLPFQAIRCSLAHVKPNDDDNEKWTEEAFEDFSQHLDCVFWVNQHTKIENGHYEVDLVDPETLTQVASKLALNGHCQLVGQLFDVSKFESSQPQVKSAPIGSQQQQQQKVVVVGEDGNNEKMDSQSEKVSIDKKIITTTTERESKTQKLGLKLKEIREQFNEIKSHIALLSDLDLNDNGHCDDDDDEEEDLSLPSLVVSQDLIAAEKFPDKVTWSQSLQGLTFKLQFHGFEVNQSQVYIRVEPKILQFHYLDIDEKNRCCQLFRIPNLALFTQVKPQDTRIVVKPTLIKIYLQKAQSLYWPKPCFDQVTKKGVTHPWLRQEVVEISDSEDNDEDVEGLNVTPMSILGAPNEIDYFSDNEDVVKEADYGDSEDSSEDTNQVPDD